MRLIDADKIINDLEAMRTQFDAIAIDGMIRGIEKQPTIEAEPVRHGKWIGLEYDGYADGSPVYDLWECSECQMEHEGEEDTLTDYFPHCGAKMDLEE